MDVDKTGKRKELYSSAESVLDQRKNFKKVKKELGKDSGKCVDILKKAIYYIGSYEKICIKYKISVNNSFNSSAVRYRRDIGDIQAAQKQLKRALK